MNKAYTILPLVIALGGCMKFSEITTPPQTVTFTSERAQTASSGLTNVQMRVVQSTKAGINDDVEVIGARCSLKGNGFKASFTAPANLRMPGYIGAADPFTITCNGGGQSATMNVKPVNQTVARMSQPVPTTGGLVGVLVGAAVQGAIRASRDPLKDQFTYPAIVRVTFENS